MTDTSSLRAFIEARLADDAEGIWTKRYVTFVRRIYDKHAPVVDGTQSSWEWLEGSESASERALLDLAAIFSDHPDYRTSWAPETVIPAS